MLFEDMKEDTRSHALPLSEMATKKANKRISQILQKSTREKLFYWMHLTWVWAFQGSSLEILDWVTYKFKLYNRWANRFHAANYPPIFLCAINLYRRFSYWLVENSLFSYSYDHLQFNIYNSLLESRIGADRIDNSYM